MLKRTLHFVSVVLLSVVVTGLSGCPFKKKKPPVPPPAAQAPTPTAPSTEQPPAQPPAAEPKEEQKPEAVVVKPKPKPKPKPPQNAHKPAPAPPKPEEKPQQQATAKPPKIVIQEGGAPNTGSQISTPMGHDESTHRRLSTAQLIESTESNLRSLNRTLTADERATVAQIKDYIEQSQAATAQQDLVRAHNLALKAHLLSDELAKQ